MKLFFGKHTRHLLGISLVISILLGWVQRSWGVGYFFGLVTMIVNVLLIQRHVDQLMFVQKNHKFGNFLFYTLANLMLGVPMLISGLYPDKSNILAVAAGELSLKYAFYLYELFIKKEEA